MIQIPDSLVKRNEERAERLGRKKEEAGEEENLTDVFRETFRSKQTEIESALDSAEKIRDRQELAERFNTMSKDIQSLNKYVSTSALFLIPYDLRMSKTVLQELQERVNQAENRLLPKRKFGFSRIAQEKKKEEIIIPKRVDQVDLPKKEELIFDTGFGNRVGEVLTLSRDELIGKDVVLTKLQNCVVYLLGTCSTLHLSQISGCRLLCGPVSTSVFIEGCKNSLIAVACQQLRVHQTVSTDFYIHVTTKAIIEDSNDVKFAPYAFSYSNLVQDFHISGLDPNANNWDKVDDFNWLVNNKQSPNWRIIEENERVKLTL